MWIFSIFFIVIYINIDKINCAPLPQEQLPDKNMENFMKKFGYIKSGPENADALLTVEGFKQAVQLMQKFGGLPQTGELDEATINLTRAARCGVPDVVPSRRRKRYIIGSDAWRKKQLTYFLANWPPELDLEITSSRLSKALSLWAEVTPLRFVPKNNMDADLIIAFGRGPHGDGYPFDGPGGVLAHAFFPYEHDSFGGDIHFDDDENWIDGAVDNRLDHHDGVDFFTVAAHEIGHSLGLAHSTVPESIMFPYYKGYNSHLRLDYDDVYAMYSMYVLDANFEDTEENEDDQYTHSDDPSMYTTHGSNIDKTSSITTQREHHSEAAGEYDWITSSYADSGLFTEDDHSFSPDSTEGEESLGEKTTTSYEQQPRSTSYPELTSVVPNRSDKPNLCNGSLDAASLIRGELFVFKQNYVWRLRDRDEVLHGYPVDFHVFFRGLPLSVRSIDSVYQRPIDYKIIFFAGQYYWIFDGNRFTVESPLPLTKLGLPSDLDHLDAALVWAKNGRTYFFSKDLYWRYNETAGEMEKGYPQRITRWRGIEQNINTAFTWKDEKTYFFKGDIFWRFNNQKVRIDEQYPLPISQYWFGCSS